MTWIFFWDINEMWSFQLRCWSTVTPRNLALFTRCTTSFHKITLFWGVRFFLLDNMIICVLFKLRVRLLESNHNATLANSVLRISIALSIEAFWTYTVVSSAKSTKKTGYYSSSQYHCRLEREGDQVLNPMEQLYLNLMMLNESVSRIQSVPYRKGNYGSIVEVLNGHHIAWF